MVAGRGLRADPVANFLIPLGIPQLTAAVAPIGALIADRDRFTLSWINQQRAGMTTPQAIAEFWKAIARCSDTLAQSSSADDPIYDKLLAQLQQIDAGLFFEFSTGSEDCELIITADGNRALFDLVEAVVSAAPQIKGWKVFALKPRLGFPETTEWEGYRVVIADVVFDPLEDGSDDFGLRLFLPAIRDEEAEKAHSALLRAIDHGLGEREFAEAVQYTEVSALEGPPEDYIPLVELENFVRWRKERRKR